MFPLMSANSKTGYNLTRSLRTRASASGYLNRTPSVGGDQKTWTLSEWVKRGTLGTNQTLIEAYAGTGGQYTLIYFYGSGDVIRILNAFTTELITTQVFRDPSAWYHIVLAFDTTQATATNRVKLYVNGVQVTAFTAATYPALNDNTYLNRTTASTYISESTSTGNGFPFDGYLTEVNFIDGQALTPSSFGSTNALTGVWQPARYTGTYGTNGFYLPFTDNSALTTSSNVGLGKDFSGNGNYWTTNNISITAGVTYDSMTDVPTLTSATASNYCVLNAINQPSSTTLNDGNLKIVATTASYRLTQSSFTLTSGKYYFEMTKLTTAQYVNGLALVLPTIDKNTSTINQAGVYLVTHGNPNQITSYTNGGGSVLIGTVDWANNDIIQCAYDATTGKIWFGRNGTYYPATNGGTIGDPAAGTNQTVTGVSGLTPTVISYDTASSCAINFGQRPFSYTPPSGFVSLNTFNLPDSTIVKGSDNMNIALATGASIKSTTEALFSGQFLEWIKDRANVNNHQLLDGVRGLSAVLQSNTTAAETTYSAPSGNSVGFAWKAGSSASSNTSGTITSTVSVNASAGFSIATFTTPASGSFTVGHGLGVAPALIIPKARVVLGGWPCYHASLGNTQYINLDLTNAAAANSGAWNNTSPSSSVITFGSTGFWGTSAPYVAYCWTPIAGCSAFGSLTGNGSADGVFVYLGFKPRFILYKRTDSTSDWRIWDTARSPYNAMSSVLYPNVSDAEFTASSQDFDALSNGFKIRNSSAAMNASSGTYIYAAFASNPFRNSLAQ